MANTKLNLKRTIKINLKVHQLKLATRPHWSFIDRLDCCHVIKFEPERLSASKFMRNVHWMLLR